MINFDDRILTADSLEQVGETVTLAGWVDSIRDHGGLVFIDLRDWSGKVQIVISPDEKEAFETAKKLGREYVIGVRGEVRNRAKELVNPNIPSGAVEIYVEELDLINKSKPIPFPIDTDGHEIDENVRLKYRYVDLRRERLKEIVKKRQRYISAVRKHMEENGFTEVITPLLTVSSPEGARDFLVPSRIHKGKVFVLPQAPQQYKQLLMASGVDKYFQIAPCARDEDPRADRHAGVFYQIDMEMSFPTIDKIFSACENLIKDTYPVVAEQKKIKEFPFPRLTYVDAMNRFGSDKPDLRFELELRDFTDVVKGKTEFNIFNNAQSVKAIVIPQAADWTRKEIDALEEYAKSEGAKGLAYLKLKEGKLEGGIAKFMTQIEEELVESIKGYIQSEIGVAEQSGDNALVVFAAGDNEFVNKLLGKVRSKLGDLLNLKDPNIMAFAWIQDFPFYDVNEETGKLDFGHNPFSMPVGGPEAFDEEDPLKIVSNQYDLAFNGYEILSGSIRNHDPEVLVKAFEKVGYDAEVVKKKFGALYTAFQYGVPPHGGWAIGIDRMFMEMVDEPNIRDVYAFPKNSNGMDVLMGAPSIPDPEDLKVLGMTLPKVKGHDKKSEPKET